MGALGCTFDEDRSRWLISDTQEKDYSCKYLISGVGQLNRAKKLNISGKNAFEGALFHSSEWQHDFDITNKSVAVIGNGPTGAQIIPAIVDDVKELYVFQRTPTWIYPRNDKTYGKLSKLIFKHIPYCGCCDRSDRI